MTVTKYARRTELAADTDEFIERMTRPEVAYLAVSGLFEDKREWVFFGMSIDENNIAGGGFQFGRTTYLEAYLVRKIIIERLDANGVLVEVCPGGLDYFYRAVQLRKTLYQQPDAEAAGSTLRDRIKHVAAITAAPGERIAYRSYGVRLRAVK